MEKNILKIAKRIQAIAQTGLRFTNDNFDKQRYEELREISVELASNISEVKIEKIRDIFTCENGFQTPKIDIRSIVLKDGKVLMTRERSDKKWSLPGGYADINYSPKEVAEKEVFEETGLKVKVNRLLAIVDTDYHNFPPLEFHFYKIIFLCDLIGGTIQQSNETSDARFFELTNLPDLSSKRNTKELIELLKSQLNEIKTYCD